MRYQEQVVKLTQKALEDVCRAALAVPTDKQDWVGEGEMRSVLSQMREVATQAQFFMPIIRDGQVPVFDRHAQIEAKKLRESYSSVAECVTAARSTLPELMHAISAVSDDRLEDEFVLPFGGGSAMTLADLLMLAHWNMVYHLGQINQIQLMLGDREMH